MAAPSQPIITTNGGNNYSTNIADLFLEGTCDITTHEILVNNSTTGVTYTPGNTSWNFSGTLSRGDNNFQVVAKNIFGDPSTATLIIIKYVDKADLEAEVSAPTGLRMRTFSDKVRLSWAENPETDIKGYNVYGSTYAAGGLEGYKKLNTSLISTIAFFEEKTTLLSENINTIGDIRTTTTEESIETINYYNYDHTEYEGEPITAGTRYYYTITAVIFDSIRNEEVESVYSNELFAYPLALSTNIVDLPKRTMFEIQVDIINKILESKPDIDLKPGESMRDIMIDPVSDELENAYFIIDFLSKSQSFATLLQIDDENNDGETDLVEDSAYKQSLKEATHLEEDSDVQQLVDDAFDKQSQNYNTVRQEAEKSYGEITFYSIQSSINQNIEFGPAQNTRISTLGDSSVGERAIQFDVVSSLVITPANYQSYYNTLTSRYEVTLPIRAAEAGIDGNVEAGKITQSISGVPANFGVTNLESTQFGTDKESNRSLAERALLVLTSLDIGTKGGYRGTALRIVGVNKVKIVGAQEELMMRDYDPIRQKHIGGKVDVYMQGQRLVEKTETFSFEFKGETDAQFDVLSAINMTVQTRNTEVISDYPIYEVTQIRNVTKGSDYDLTNLIITIDTLDIDETIPANLAIGMASGDRIEVDYKYRKSENFIFAHQPVITLNDVQGSVTGNLNNNIEFFQTEDPLLNGKSTAAQDYFIIKYTGGIPSGNAETLTVKYTINELLDEVQEEVNEKRHITADVLVKEATEIGIDVDMTVYLKEATNRSLADSKIRTAVSNLLNQKAIGQSVYQSDVIRVVEEVEEVDHVDIPFTKMVRADGAIRIREEISASWSVYDIGIKTSFTTGAGALEFATILGGGTKYEHKGVFLDEIETTLVDDPNLVKYLPGRSYIGTNGEVIISTPDNTMDNHTVMVSYVVYGESGSKDIELQGMEFLSLNNLNITYGI